MPGWMQDWPVLGVFLFFLFGAVARSQAIYWVGRGVTAGVLRSRWGDRLDSPQVRRATTTFERWGMPVVPLAFLTVGFQSAVFASVGLLRVHWLRYTLWTIPGCLVWAALWGGSGLAVVAAAVALARRSPWALVAALLVVAAAGVLIGLRLRRRREQRGSIEDLADEAGQHGSPRV
jgi:membrane protein DedA with SNARE-associated domain